MAGVISLQERHLRPGQVDRGRDDGEVRQDVDAMRRDHRNNGDDAERPGRGLARAKTGTLNSVVTLSGHVTTDDGAEDADPPYAARQLLDHAEGDGGLAGETLDRGDVDAASHSSTLGGGGRGRPAGCHRSGSSIVTSSRSSSGPTRMASGTRPTSW